VAKEEEEKDYDWQHAAKHLSKKIIDHVSGEDSYLL